MFCCSSRVLSPTRGPDINTALDTDDDPRAGELQATTPTHEESDPPSRALASRAGEVQATTPRHEEESAQLESLDVALPGDEARLHRGGGPREQYDATGTQLLYRMAAVSEETANRELTCEYPAYGQAFAMGFTEARGLVQDVFPKVQWAYVPVQSFDDLSSDATWAAKLDDTMQRYISSRGLPGGAQLAVAKDGRLLYSRTFGVADMTDRAAAPPTEDALFHYGSISKSITAVAAMLLVEDGVLDLDASVFELLGGIAPVVDTRVLQIRVWHLMNHTAGMSDGGGMGTGYADTRTPAATAAMLQKVTLTNSPGEVFEYCNTGPNIVSRIIEVLTGQDYDAFVLERIWSPLGCTKPPVVSSMYRQHPGEVLFYHPTRPGQIKADKSNLYWKYLWGGRAGSQGNRELGLEAAGGWKGSAGSVALLGADLLASLQGAPSAKLLSAESVKTMMAPGSKYAAPMGGAHYSLGFITWSMKPQACTAEAPAVDWETSYAQWMHGGTFGSALHVDTSKGGVAWAFCLNAPPHFETAHEPDHVAEPDGLKAQLRQVIFDALFKEGVRF